MSAFTVHSMIAIFHPYYFLHYRIDKPNKCYIRNATHSFSLQSPFLNTCGCRKCSISATPTEQLEQWRWESQRRPGCGTESSSTRVQPRVSVLLLCASWQTRSRKQPVPLVQRAGPGLFETASVFSLCNCGEEIFWLVKITDWGKCKCNLIRMTQQHKYMFRLCD